MTLKELKGGTYVKDLKVAVVSSIEKKTRANKIYLELILSDDSSQLPAKVWEDKIKSTNVDVGKVAIIKGRVEEYEGKTQIIIEEASTDTQARFEDFLTQPKTMIFDIETVGYSENDLSEWDQEYLTTNLERDLEAQEAIKRAGLYSLYGFVQSIGITTPSKHDDYDGLVLCLSNTELKPENNKFKYQVFKEEKELLEAFWNLSTTYQRFVTYNGKGFDWPYLIIRSGINRVVVPFEINHYDDNRFIDLQDKLKQGGRGFKLEALCRAFGISNPKDKGVSGLHVSNLYYDNDFQSIADYVARDAISTLELYRIWRSFLSGKPHA